VRRQWQAGDQVHLRLPIAPRWVATHPGVLENTGRAALMYGPLVYCLEAAANPEVEIGSLEISLPSEFQVKPAGDLKLPIVAIEFPGKVAAADPRWANRLYALLQPGPSRAGAVAKTVRAIPYFAWANRDPGPMRVFIKVNWKPFPGK
jgi:DUF1680 family protein